MVNISRWYKAIGVGSALLLGFMGENGVASAAKSEDGKVRFLKSEAHQEASRAARTNLELYLQGVIEDSGSARAPFKIAYLKVNKAELLHVIDCTPGFSIAADNYFVTGMPLDRGINRHTADAKFQVSVQQRLTRTVLPLNSYLVVRYTQKSFWDVYRFSSPFKDNNYNPALGLIAPVFRADELVGAASLFVEHESNGLGGEDSRSWNFLSFSYTWLLNPQTNIQAKVWAPLLAEENKDLLHYRGIGFVAMNIRNPNGRIRGSLLMQPSIDFKRGALTSDVAFNVTPRRDQYVFLQLFFGYAEGMLRYKERVCMLRAGFCIKPTFFTFR